MNQGDREPGYGDTAGAQSLFPEETYFETVNIYQMLTDGDVSESGWTPYDNDKDGTVFVIVIWRPSALRHVTIGEHLIDVHCFEVGFFWEQALRTRSVAIPGLPVTLIHAS